MTKEKKDEENHLKKIQNFSQNIKKTLENLSPKIPNITLPEIEKIESPDVIKERNNWERHSDIMEIQDNVLKIQKGILDEQKSTSKMTLAILIITIIALVISSLTFLKMIGWI